MDSDSSGAFWDLEYSPYAAWSDYLPPERFELCRLSTINRESDYQTHHNLWSPRETFFFEERITRNLPRAATLEAWRVTDSGGALVVPRSSRSRARFNAVKPKTKAPLLLMSSERFSGQTPSIHPKSIFRNWRLEVIKSYHFGVGVFCGLLIGIVSCYLLVTTADLRHRNPDHTTAGNCDSAFYCSF